MKEEFVSYEQALRLKELGFRWECNRYYSYWYVNENPSDDTKKPTLHRSGMHDHNGTLNNPIYEDGPHSSAPTQALAAKWLREVKGIEVFVIPFHIQDTKGYKWIIETDDILFPSRRAAALYVNHDDALSQGISQALTLLTEKQ